MDILKQLGIEENNFGAFTGSVNSKMLKSVGANYVILGHSENRSLGENDILINSKIKASIKNKLKIIFCIGETLAQKKKKKTHKVLKSQIIKGLKGVRKIENIFFSYEPIWSIGSGLIPSNKELESNISFIKKTIQKRFKVNKPKILYGGSVNPNNVIELKKIDNINGFLIGGASQDSKKFIDIVKKTFK